MKIAKNKDGKYVKILNSDKSDSFYCICCGNELQRIFTPMRQYFKHPIGIGDDCENKLKNLNLDTEVELTESDLEILEKHLYNKEFEGMETIMSDYKSEEGYLMTQEQKDIIFSKEDRVKIEATAGCVDKDTEFFNGYEWKKISEYVDGDKVLQYTKDRTGELVTPIRYVKEKCNLMHSYNTKYGVDMVLSEEHRMIYIDTSHYNKQDSNKKCNLLEKTEMEVRKIQKANKNGFSGKFITTFDYNGDGRSNLTEYELRLMVAVMADGHYRSKTSNLCRVNIKKQYKKDRLEYLLDKCGIKYNKNKYNKQDFEFDNYSFYTPIRAKKYPKEWYNLSKKELEIIYDEFPKWDGTNAKDNRGVIFRTSNKSDADFIQFVITVNNKRATIDINDHVGETYILSTNEKEYTRKSVLYTVRECGRSNLVGIIGGQNKNSKDEIIKEFTPIDGFKYCFEVPSGMLILRRNDKIFITGNSSKSTTLYYYAKERPFKRILYVVYNASMKKEAEHTFGKLPNVTIKTLHGLAYGTFGIKYKRKLMQGSYSARDVMMDLRMDDIELAVKIKEYFNLFLLSDLKSIDLMYKEFSDDNQSMEILSGIKRLFELKKDLTNNVKVEHDFYLKLYHLSQPNLSKYYDVLLLDESQDSNTLTYDIIINSGVKGIVMVGDSRQTLYKWRMAINIMNDFEATEYKLSTSFRISNNVAHLCNLLINQLGADSKFKILGFNSENKFVHEVDENEPFVILCRTNSSILERAFEYISEDKKLFFVGGYNGYKFENLLDIFSFKNGRRVNNPLFNKYDSYRQMIEIAEKSNDVEILILKYMVEKYDEKIPYLINKVKKNTVTDETLADVTMSTVHKSKGLTIKKNLVIHGDHLDVQDMFEKMYLKSEDVDVEKFLEEIYIIYVGITRGARNIKISESLCKYFVSQFKVFKKLMK